jgi:hypothetical protein
MTLDPERDGWWDLRTAIMRTSSEWWPELMVAIRRDLRALRARSVPFAAPEWWSDNMAPETAPPHQERRSPQDLISSLQVNLAAVETKFRHDLYEGKRIACGRLGSSLTEYKEAPPWAVVGVESWWRGGGILQLESGEGLYAARIKPSKPSTGNGDASKRRSRRGAKGKPYRPLVTKQALNWLRQQRAAIQQVDVEQFIEARS